MRFVFISVVLCFSAGLLAAQEPWPAIPPEDLALTDNPESPGSAAMILLKKESRDDAKRIWETSYRIKVFTDRGRDYGDIEIPYAPGRAEVDAVSARVTQADGRTSEFRGPIYDKTLARRGKFRLMAKAFTLPEVGPGAIIDYRYRLKFKNDALLNGPWVIQEKLFVREANIEFRPANKEGYHHKVFPRFLPYLVTDDKDIARSTLRNLPAFDEEPSMPPESMLKMRYHVLYSPDYTYMEPVEALQRLLNDYIGKPNALASAVREITSEKDPPDVKVRKIYVAVQERIRNLSYEEAYTKQERRRENIRERKSAPDVWRFGYGTAEEIVFLFAGLCRTAGLIADPIGVIERDSQFYDPDISRVEQLDGWLVVVDLPTSSPSPQRPFPEGGRLFDPGTRFAPPGSISWTKQGVHGIRFGTALTSTADIEVSLRSPAENSLLRRAAFTLKPDGSADVRLVTTYTGEEAIERRNDFFDLSKEEREKHLRSELKEIFPAARVQEIAWDGMDDVSERATISYRFELRDVAHVLGPRLLIQQSFFGQSSRFPNLKRTYPVYLRRSADVSEEWRIELPAGYELEHAADPVNFNVATKNLTFGQYESSTSKEGSVVLRRTRLTTSAAVIDPSDYLPLKRFFDRVAASAQGYLLLRQASKE